MRKNSIGSPETLLVRNLGFSSGEDEPVHLFIDADLQFSARPPVRAPLPDITELREIVEQSVLRVERNDQQKLLAAVLEGLISSYPHLARADVTLWQVAETHDGERLGLRGSRDRFLVESKQGRSIRQPRPR